MTSFLALWALSSLVTALLAGHVLRVGGAGGEDGL